MADRPDQIMADNLTSWAISGVGITPKERLQPIINKHLGPGVTNLEHMSATLDYLVNKTPRSIERLAKLYEQNFSGTFRGEFECLSVGYAGYNSLAAIDDYLHGDNTICELARKYTRWDTLLHILCANTHGRLAFPCGRIYAIEGKKIALNPAMEFRTREAGDIRSDGWWPPVGVGKNFWNSTGQSALPYFKNPNLIKQFFSDNEREDIQTAIKHRLFFDNLARLYEDIKISQVLKVVIKKYGHVAWIENIRSYRAGKNRAQSVTWNQNGYEGGFVSRPPVQTSLNGNTFTIVRPMENNKTTTIEPPFPIYDQDTVGMFTFTENGGTWVKNPQ